MTCDAQASAAIEEGGMEFPRVRKFWQGDASRALGAGTRYKKFAFVGVKVTLSAETVALAESLSIVTHIRVRSIAWRAASVSTKPVTGSSMLRALQMPER